VSATGVTRQGRPEDGLDEATLAVVIHGLLTSVSVINGGAITLRDSWDALKEPDRVHLLSLVIGQAAHVGGVLHDLMRALPHGLVTALDALQADHDPAASAAAGAAAE
jgi:hypothetical protein